MQYQKESAGMLRMGGGAREGTPPFFTISGNFSGAEEVAQAVYQDNKQA